MPQPTEQSPQRIRRGGRTYRVIDELRVRGRRYWVLDRLGNRHRPRLLLDDPATQQLRVALILPNESSTIQHLHVLRRLPPMAELPQILDYQRRGDETIILLQWLQGIDLGQYLQRIQQQKVAAPMPCQVVRLVRGLGHGLRQLHLHAQVVHGDLKPQNLLITRKPSRLGMIDFGSAWTTEQARYRLEGDGLSPIYAAPEMLSDSPRINTQADQFSATLILYQLLTGTIPFSSLGGQAGRPGYREEFDGTLVPPSTLAASEHRLPLAIWKKLDALVLRGLQFDPDERFPHTSAWLDALDDIFFQMEVARREPPPPPGAWQRFLDLLTNSIFGEPTT